MRFFSSEATSRSEVADWGRLYAIVSSETGWSVEQISHLNLSTLRILAESWNDLAKERAGEKTEKATPEKIKALKRMLKGVR